MARVKRGVTAHAKHKKVYKSVKGQRGRRKEMHWLFAGHVQHRQEDGADTTGRIAQREKIRQVKAAQHRKVTGCVSRHAVSFRLFVTTIRYSQARKGRH